MQRFLLRGFLGLFLGLSGLLSAQTETPAAPLKDGLVPPAGAVATINGEPIRQKAFVDGLYSRFAKHVTGSQALENLISQKVIDAQMKDRQLQVTSDDAVAEFDRLDKELKKATKGQTDLPTEMKKKGMRKSQMLDLLRYKIALEKLSALDFNKEKSTPAEQEQWLRAKRADARIEIDATELPEDAAARVYDGFVTKEEFAGALIVLLESNESVKLVEAHMQARLTEQLCAAQGLDIGPKDVSEVYAQVKARFEEDPRYQGVSFANFVQERYGMDAATHRNSANFRREVCLSRLGDTLVGADEAARLYREKEREFGPIYRLRHIIIRGSDEPQFAGKMRKLDEARKVADDVWKRIDSGKMAFEEAASLFSEDARSKFKKGEWDSFAPAQLDKMDGGAAILELEVGENSRPLLFQGGYRIVKLEETAPVPPLSPEVARELRRQKAFEFFAKAWKSAERGYDLERLLIDGFSK